METIVATFCVSPTMMAPNLATLMVYLQELACHQEQQEQYDKQELVRKLQEQTKRSKPGVRTSILTAKTIRLIG